MTAVRESDAPPRGSAADLPDWFVKRKRNRNLIVSRTVPIVMVGIPVLVLVAIVIFPTVWMAFHSFHDTSLISLFNRNWSNVGWQNYGLVLGSERFQDSVGRLVIYLAFGATLQVIVGAALALIIFELIKNRLLQVIVLILLVLPMMLPPSIVGVIWKFLLQANNGAINHLLINIGVLAPEARIEWLDAKLSLWSIVLADVWQWTSLPLLIVYSGRVSLPPAVYEAARVDGASAWLVLRRITLPMLKEVIAIAFIIRFMDAYKFVDKVFVMTAGGPAQSSELPVFIAFQKGVREFQIGEAAAYAWIIFVFAAILITLFLQYMKRVLRAQGFV